MKKILILILAILILSTSMVLGKIEDTVSMDFESPKFLTLSLEGENFILKWTNSIDSMVNDGMEYQIDFRLGRDKWASEKGKLVTNELVFDNNGKSEISFNPIENDLVKNIDLESNNYNLRIRYKYNETYSEFSNIVSLGLMPYYENASFWAIEELDKATDIRLIPESIREDMRKEITREEFAEVIIRLYELQTGQTVNYEEGVFVDCSNTEVLKAAKLGIVKGDANKNFLPKNNITREEVAVMLKRTLEALYPNMDFKLGENPDLSEEEISSWAYDSMKYMTYKEILKGDINGKINPQNHTTREEAVIFALRVYEQFDFKKSNIA